MWLSLWGGGGVHWSRGGQGFEASGPAIGWLWSSGVVFPPFYPLCCFACGVLPANMPLFAILRGFSEGFPCSVWVCLAWVLCVDCGAFYARVRLGGFGACGVFAFIFLLFAYRFIYLPIFRGFAFVALLVLFACFVCSCVFVVAFSLSDYAQKERAQFLASSFVLLWACL